MAKGEIYRIEIPIIVDDQTDTPLKQAEQKINRFEKSALKSNERIRRIFGREIRLRIGAVDKARPVIRSVQTHLRGLTGRAWNITLQAKDKVSGIIRGITGGIKRIGKLLMSPLTLLGVGGGIGGLTKFGIDMVIERENITMAFETLLGSADAAKQRIEELTEFAGQTPFMRDEIYEASRILEVFTRGALSTSKGLKLVGDVAAGTGQDYKDVAVWIGRLYDAMASGRPVGEMTARLQEMGAISGEQRAMLEQLAKSGKDIAYTWPQAEKVFSRFEGQMERMSTGLGNMLTSVKSFFRETVLLRWGQGIEAELRPVLESFRQWRKESPEQVKAIGDTVERIARTGMKKVVELFKNGYGLISDIINDESMTWDEKIRVALDRILEAVNNWLEGTGGERIREAGNILGTLLAAGLEGASPHLVSVALELGKSIAMAILEGFGRALSSSPLGAIIMGSLGGAAIGSVVPGVGTVLGALGGGVSGLGAWAGGKVISATASKTQQSKRVTNALSSSSTSKTSKRAQARRRAIGGIFSTPHLGLVAEAGPEAIIPLSERMRSRALRLYEEAGKYLGVRPYAEGGFAGSIPNLAPVATRFSVPTAGTTISVINYIDVKVGGSNADPDSIAEAIAAKIESVFHNMTK